jgi:hypothetical protein
MVDADMGVLEDQLAGKVVRHSHEATGHHGATLSPDAQRNP